MAGGRTVFGHYLTGREEINSKLCYSMLGWLFICLDISVYKERIYRCFAEPVSSYQLMTYGAVAVTGFLHAVEWSNSFCHRSALQLCNLNEMGMIVIRQGKTKV
ncbi:hypothetical protein LOAG_01008 [Loa loa]|uniref:Uncharacterized protein n=1 Tax=Loa loa TaxID=7209 RepID=A0A1S0UAP6_LOALO|nr:hypothetical protein LOAG_01008 [Loa loa]EFO27477.1 hypothetical protein LOAG_01008 [Loa loa]